MQIVKATLNGMVSRGVKHAFVDADGRLIFHMTDGHRLDLGVVVGADGVSITDITADAFGVFTVYFSDGTTKKVGNDLYSAVRELTEQANTYAGNAAESAQAASDDAGAAFVAAGEAAASAEEAKEAAESMQLMSFEMSDDGCLFVNRALLLESTNFSLNDNGELEVNY